MPSNQNTPQDESPTLSDAEPSFFRNLPQLTEAQVQANREYNGSLPRQTEESRAEMLRQMLDNLNANSLARG